MPTHVSTSHGPRGDRRQRAARPPAARARRGRDHRRVRPRRSGRGERRPRGRGDAARRRRDGVAAAASPSRPPRCRSPHPISWCACDSGTRERWMPSLSVLPQRSGAVDRRRPAPIRPRERRAKGRAARPTAGFVAEQRSCLHSCSSSRAGVCSASARDDRLGRQAGGSARKPLGFEDERAEGRESVHRELDFRSCEPGRELDLGRRQREPHRWDQVREMLTSGLPRIHDRAQISRRLASRGAARAEAAAIFASSSCGAGCGAGRRLCSAPTRSEGVTAAAWSCRRRA
jgi:hypothetical protein